MATKLSHQRTPTERVTYLSSSDGGGATVRARVPCHTLPPHLARPCWQDHDLLQLVALTEVNRCARPTKVRQNVCSEYQAGRETALRTTRPSKERRETALRTKRHR